MPSRLPTLHPPFLVYRVGSTVKIAQSKADPPIEATVTQINIGECGIRYEVVWWDGKTRRNEWVCSFEILDDVPAVTHVRMGFIGE